MYNSIKQLQNVLLLGFMITGCTNPNTVTTEEKQSITKEDVIGNWEHVKRQTTRRVLDKNYLAHQSGQMIWRFEEDSIFVFSYPNSVEYIFDEYWLTNDTLYYTDQRSENYTAISFSSDTMELKYTNDKGEWYVDYFVKSDAKEEQLQYLKKFETDWKQIKGEWTFKSVERFPANYEDNCDITVIKDLPKLLVIDYLNDANTYNGRKIEVPFQDSTVSFIFRIKSSDELRLIPLWNIGCDYVELRYERLNN